MWNKKKRLTQTVTNYSTAVASGSNDFEMVAVKENSTKPNDSIEIKQKSDIKSEPVDSSDLFDVPASTYCNATSVVGPSEFDSGHYFDNFESFVGKDEMKEECDGKKDKKLMINADTNDKAVDQQVPLQDQDNLPQPESGNDTNDTQKRGSGVLKNSPIKHKCKFCEYSAQYKCLLNRHLLKHIGEKPHACHLCPKRFTTKQSLRSHMKAHVAESLFHCATCLQGFDEKEEKSTHEASCKILRYECYICKDSFGSTNTNMIDHMRVHSGGRPFECSECFKQFKQKSALNEHKKIHTRSRPFCCSKCHQGFKREDERNSHEEKCSRKVYECDMCGKWISLYKSELIRHMRTHTGERPFQCKQCPKKFTEKSHLTEHMKTHSGEKPFQCEKCRRRFAWKSNLNRHMKRIHNKE